MCLLARRESPRYSSADGFDLVVTRKKLRTVLGRSGKATSLSAELQQTTVVVDKEKSGPEMQNPHPFSLPAISYLTLQHHLNKAPIRPVTRW